jgi:hypothetical protein
MIVLLIVGREASEPTYDASSAMGVTILTGRSVIHQPPLIHRRTFVVTTVAPLEWDASCTTDRKIVAGEIHATLGDGSYISTTWTGCGKDPMRMSVPVS